MAGAFVSGKAAVTKFGKHRDADPWAISTHGQSLTKCFFNLHAILYPLLFF
jgi:hypothetical protein